MPEHIELNPVSHLTVGTQGKPGERTFYLQGGRGSQTISLVIEKEQARMLAASLESLLEELEERLPAKPEMEGQVWRDMRLKEPVEPLFRVGNMGLGFNEGSNQIVLVAYELVDEGEEPNVVSFWLTAEMGQSIIPHVRDVVRSGRFVDAGSETVPKQNGHVH